MNFDRRKGVEPPASTIFARAYRYITLIRHHDSDETREWMLTALALQTTPLVVGSLSTAVTASIAFVLTGEIWLLVWLASDFGLTAFRFAILRNLNSGAFPDRRKRQHACLMSAGLAWAGLYGMGSGEMLATAYPPLWILGSLNVAGAVGTISMRNAGTPRFGVLAMAFCAAPLDVRLFMSSNPVGPCIALAIPLLLVGFCAVLRQNTRLLLRTFQAERRLDALAHTDPLTGLANRKSLDEALDALPILKPDGSPFELTILCLDLDDFKPVNDTFGHDAGDVLLKEVATRLGRTLREKDGVFRIGGDEFVCTLPDVGLDRAEGIAGRLIAAISSPVDLGDDRSVRVGASIGMATRNDARLSNRHLLKLADHGLYEAKQRGKNRYAIHAWREDDPERP